MRGGNSDPSKQQQWEYNKNDNNNNNNNASVYRPQFSDESATAQTTRLFIDAISSNKEEAISRNQPPSLSLSMCNEKGDLGIGMMVKNQWAWMNSGGPLGEALCLGNASTTSNLTSPRSYGYSNNSNTNSSSEDGSHALNFIG